MTKRICIFCKQCGIEVEFTSGNELKRHIRKRHPSAGRTPVQRQSIRMFRRQQIMLRAKLMLD